MLIGMLLISLTLALVLLAAIPTTRDILKRGKAADPLRREIEKEKVDDDQPKAA